MKVKSLHLENFKRFTDLSLKEIPENCKLVLLIGSNGSGKSSVFDAFEYLSKYNGKQWKDPNLDFKRNKAKYNTVVLETYEHGEEGQINDVWTKSDELSAASFYGRTSFRQVPRLTRTHLGSGFDITTDADRAGSFIDREERFENDLEYILGKLLKEFFRTDREKSEIKNEVIDPINDALERMFGSETGTKLSLLEIIPPLSGKTAEINFKKGENIFHYNFLSAGEKEVFNILINLIARKEYYQDTVYFFDEIDLHLNTKIQYNLLKEIVENWLPGNCQLWTASHSLGFIDYANDLENAVIFDFDDLDFDQPQVLFPQPKNDAKVFEIAVGKAFIDKFIQGRKILFSENTDTPFYNDLAFENTLFFSAIDKTDAFFKAKNLALSCLIDRDFLSDEEIVSLKTDYPFARILPFYSFENLLFHPDNLEEYYLQQKKVFVKQEYIQKLTQIKNEERDYIVAGITGARSGYPFYKENEKSKKLKSFKENFKEIIVLLRSDEFDSFYKVFPMKDFGKQLKERENLSKANLIKTSWFANQIHAAIK